MKCAFCEAENRPNANFCSNCGSPLTLQVCPKCEAVNEKTAATCINCGQALAKDPTLDSGDNDTVVVAAASTDDTAAVETPAPAEDAKALLQDIEEEVKRRRRVLNAEEVVDKASRLAPQQSPAPEETTVGSPAQSRAWREECTFNDRVQPRSWLRELLAVALVGGAVIAAYYFHSSSPEKPAAASADKETTGSPVTTPAPPGGAQANIPSAAEAKSTGEQAVGGSVATPAPPQETSSAVVGGPTISSPQAEGNGKNLQKDNVTKKLEPRVAAKEGQISSVPASLSAAQSGDSHLTFSISPSGEIYIDGKKWGMSPPLLGLALSPGEHSVEIHHDDLPPYYKHIKLQPGETLKISYKFK